VIAAISRDPEVRTFLDPDATDESLTSFLPRVEAHWDEHGFGLWAVALAEPGAHEVLIGFAGVAYPDFLPDVAHRPELGWRLAHDAWGRGLATEAAAAARDDAFARLGLESLISIIHPANERSRRVAEKLGMAFETLVHHPTLGRDIEVWRCGRP
jgi:RimJ/RimL family protein N-acetyltransferase